MKAVRMAWLMVSLTEIVDSWKDAEMGPMTASWTVSLMVAKKVPMKELMLVLMLETVKVLLTGHLSVLSKEKPMVFAMATLMAATMVEKKEMLMVQVKDPGLAGPLELWLELCILFQTQCIGSSDRRFHHKLLENLSGRFHMPHWKSC